MSSLRQSEICVHGNNYEKHALRVSQGIAAVAGSRAHTDFGAAPPIFVFIITLSQEKSMVKTVEDIAKIAVPLIFLRFRSFLPPPSAASSVSQGHRSVPFLLP